MANEKAVYKEKVYIFPDGEVGGLSKSGGVYQIRSPSHFINLNTTDRKTAEREFEKLSNGYEEIPLEVIGRKWAKSEAGILFKKNNKGDFEPIGEIIPSKRVKEWGELGYNIKHIDEINIYYL